MVLLIAFTCIVACYCAYYLRYCLLRVGIVGCAFMVRACDDFACCVLAAMGCCGGACVSVCLVVCFWFEFGLVWCFVWFGSLLFGCVVYLCSLWVCLVIWWTLLV